MSETDALAPEQALSEKPDSLASEFRGKARAYRRRLEVVDVIAATAMDRIVAPLRSRATKGKVRPRQDAITDAVRDWRATVPEFGRLALEIDVKKASLQIRELRVAAAVNALDNWEPGKTEPAICIVLAHLQTDSETFWFETILLSVIGLHAVARRYQRAFDTSEDAMLKDFRALANAAACDDLLGLHGEFRVPAVAGGGVWVGAATLTPEGTGQQRILSVRSFISE